MFNPDFSYLIEKNKINEALEINKEFEKVYMNCEDWSFEDCILHLQLSHKPKHLSEEEFNKVLQQISNN